MTRSHKVLGFLVVALLGIYGCARGPGAAADNKAAAANEAKVHRLEEDVRTATTARDAVRLKLQAAEAKLAESQRRAEQAEAATARERQAKEGVQAELKARTAERDAMTAQYDGFRKNLRDLIGQAESALAAPSANPPGLVGTQANTAPAAATATGN